jgi:phosphoheptose isomerase
VTGSEELYTAAGAYLSASIEVKRRVLNHCLDSIVAAAHLLCESFRAGGKVLLCGNGGSAADCQHLAAEFTSQFRKAVRRPGLPAIALTTDTSFLTAFSNDCGYGGVFERLVETLGRAGDVLVAISTSGKSENVVRAVSAAHRIGMRVIALTGDGGPLAEISDIVIAVPSTDTQHTQEAHLTVEHLLVLLVEHTLFPPHPAVPVDAGR